MRRRKDGPTDITAVTDRYAGENVNLVFVVCLHNGPGARNAPSRYCQPAKAFTRLPRKPWLVVLPYCNRPRASDNQGFAAARSHARTCSQGAIRRCRVPFPFCRRTRGIRSVSSLSVLVVAHDGRLSGSQSRRAAHPGIGARLSRGVPCLVSRGRRLRARQTRPPQRPRSQAARDRASECGFTPGVHRRRVAALCYPS